MARRERSSAIHPGEGGTRFLQAVVQFADLSASATLRSMAIFTIPMIGVTFRQPGEDRKEQGLCQVEHVTQIECKHAVAYPMPTKSAI
jgi:hypothetical protein